MRRISLSRSIGLLCLLVAFQSSAGGRWGPPAQYADPHQTARQYNAAATDQPRQIALLLPATGKHADSATAIREGFFTTYYESAGQNGVKPTVRVYDSTKEKDIEYLYEIAVREGADFVVGPLSKEEVIRLARMSPSKARTPILALNYDPSVRPIPNFVQFSLAPESEAEQIAEKAFHQGHRTASIIVPDNVWGKRIATAFTARWNALGGRVLQSVQASTKHDQSGAVKKLLGIDQSQQRANQLKDILTEKVDFQPRRRQDVDMIVMAATPDLARQLKPLFDFYYAEKVPVYATSSIYNGSPNAKRDRDINGVIFCDMPWLLDPERGSEVKRLLGRSEKEHSDQYNRLFAMGVDAYHLTQRLRIMDGQRVTYPGATGTMLLDPNNVIRRKLAWAKIVNGVPVLLQTGADKSLVQPREVPAAPSEAAKNAEEGDLDNVPEVSQEAVPTTNEEPVGSQT